MGANELTKLALEYLHLKGCYCHRINNAPTRHRSNTIKKGTPDILGCDKKGRALAVEIKFGKDVMSEHQIEYRKEFEKRGGLYVVCRKVEDLIEAGL